MRRRRIGVRPSRTASTMAVAVGVGIGILGFALLGELTKVGVGGPAGGMGGPGAGVFGMFLYLWIGAVALAVLYHLRNAVRGDAPPMSQIEMIEEDDGEGALQADSRPGEASRRLKELDRLRNDGLVTDDEYRQRRRAILDEYA